MHRFAPRIALVALVVVFGLAAIGAVNPNHEYWITIFPDEAEHAGLIFAMLMLAAAVWPRAPLWLLAAPLLAAGAGLEVLQWTGLIAGQFELRDIGANILGLGAALFALACAALRRAGQKVAGRD